METEDTSRPLVTGWAPCFFLFPLNSQKCLFKKEAWCIIGIQKDTRRMFIRRWGIAMSCYIIAQIKINDREEYDIYENGFDEIFAKFKGIIVAVDEDPVVLEGEWPYTRTVLIRFPDEKEARRWYESPEYQSRREISSW
ncbi:MAG: hypothetical protein B6D63_00240 [Candidatus Latescibacteria bacterium 4484_7]|nr:MAG: hypothetical protein B6D63_00240 [Candidatus Latescibacteria bacterium 4484_7]